MNRYFRMSCTILVLTACADVMSTEPAPAENSARKAGWSDLQLSMFKAGCVQGVIVPAKRDYVARAEKSGNPAPKPFPEDAFKASVEPMCSCLAQRISQTWTYDDYIEHQMEYARPLIEEAMRGGQCKPGGVLGEALDKKAAAAPK